MNTVDHRAVLKGHTRIVALIAANEVELSRIFLVTDRGVNGFHSAHRLREQIHFLKRQIRELCELLLSRLTTVLLQELLLLTAQLVVGLRHMHRNANSVAEIRHRTGNRLTNPPSRIG